MLPFFRWSWIFKSRWLALLWAAGICWFALNFVGGPQDSKHDESPQSSEAKNDALSPEQARQIAEALQKIQ